ncbi:MAG: RNA polymerase sigma factor [Ktedonobacteraceae bacterium]|nr:RNA polymerase sigma factor [Ktedonobacteraceae bacterium]MBA3823675.1 RNA polymerase sigma factor [Ktedonobacterales bacterium]
MLPFSLTFPVARPRWRGRFLFALRGAWDTNSGSTSESFETFFRRYEPEITRYLWRMTGDEQSAGDLCQETFLRAWQHFATIRSYEKPGAWLIKVASNLALRYLHQRFSSARIVIPLDDTLGPSTSDHGRRIVEQDLVRETLLELAPRARAMLVLREVHGLTGNEIAQTLGMPRTAVKMALWRACVQFREQYERKGGRP